MYFSTATILALLSTPFLVLAADNAFIVPEEGLSATGGEPVTLKWEPSTEGTISLILRSGNSADLKEGTIIVEGAENSGSYTWTPSNDLTRGSDYTVQIVDDDDPENSNYTPYFYLDTTTTVAKVTSMVELAAPSSSIEKSTAAPTGSATSLTSLATLASTQAASTVTDTAASTSTVSETDSASASDSSATPSSADESEASASETASESAAPAEQTGNAGTRNSAMVGLLGVVAIGAFAL